MSVKMAVQTSALSQVFTVFSSLNCLFMTLDFFVQLFDLKSAPFQPGQIKLILPED